VLSIQGTIHSKVEFSSVNVNNGRFPPSELFALAFAVILLVQLASIAREYRRAGWRRFISSGWVWVDVASAAICIAIIVYDIVALVSRRCQFCCCCVWLLLLLLLLLLLPLLLLLLLLLPLLVWPCVCTCVCVYLTWVITCGVDSNACGTWN